MRLPKAMRLRLAFLANAFEFVDCVQECLQSFSEEKLTLDEAFSLLDDMPEELWQHEATVLVMSKVVEMFDAKVKEQADQVLEGDIGPEDEKAAATALKSKISTVLVNIIDKMAPEEQQGQTAAGKNRQVVRLAGEVLCKALGLVDQLFEEAATKTGRPYSSARASYTVLKLREDVKGFIPAVMKILLGSEMLQLRSENDAYYLMCAWLSQSQQIFNMFDYEGEDNEEDEDEEDEEDEGEEQEQEGEQEEEQEMTEEEADRILAKYAKEHLKF